MELTTRIASTRLRTSLIDAIEKNNFNAASTIVFCTNWYPQKEVLNEGELPILHYLLASDYNDENGEFLKLLLEGAVDPNTTKSNGDTVLHLPQYKISNKHLALLLRHGININQKNSYGRTPLMQRVLANSFLAKSLITLGAKIDHQDYEGNTALHYACQFKKFVMATLLLDNGADFNKINHKGRKPLNSFEDFFIPFHTQVFIQLSTQLSTRLSTLTQEWTASNLFKDNGECVKESATIKASKQNYIRFHFKNYDDFYKVQKILSQLDDDEYKKLRETLTDSYTQQLFDAIKVKLPKTTSPTSLPFSRLLFCIEREKEKKKQEIKNNRKAFLHEWLPYSYNMCNMSEVD